ncbi:MAG: NAD(P)-binding domain-containing protein [Lewinellaceae bacterium]|nr:NAD(P)-binding domain-containing protein [Saprospiraceae bacterium]MCB9329755.1 NAD(P)-binding domain-containing protein [Lewinellaceae bacterium]
MKIAIIGTGNVGGTLATQWANTGHQIHLGVQNTGAFKGQHLLSNPNTTAHFIPEAVGLSEVILVATPPHIAPELATQMGDVSGKVLIDATNAIQRKPEPYPTAFHAFAQLTKADVVKCFNTTGFENMKNPQYGNQRLDLFMAGDSETAKTVAARLASDAGFEKCYDFGKSDKVELLEKFALAWINLAIFQGMGRDIGFKLLSR